MALPIDEVLLRDMTLMIANYRIICDYFGLTDIERQSPNAGIWVVDCIKQYQTTANIAKTMKMRTNPVQSVEAYLPAQPLPEINPLLSEAAKKPEA